MTFLPEFEVGAGHAYAEYNMAKNTDSSLNPTQNSFPAPI